MGKLFNGGHYSREDINQGISILTIKRLSSCSAPGEVEGGCCWAKTELSSGKSVCFEYHSFNNANVIPLETPPRFRNLKLEIIF